MSEIYFEDDRHFSGTIFVKKNDGELIEGDEHDYGLLVCENDDSVWVFEPICLLRNLTDADLFAIIFKLRELNIETKSMLHDDFINSTSINSDAGLTEHVHAHVTAQISNNDWGGSGGGGEAAGGGASGEYSSSSSSDSSSCDTSSSDSSSCGGD